MNFRQFGNKKLDFERLEQIIAILAKYEFIDILKNTGLKNFRRLIRSKNFLEELVHLLPKEFSLFLKN